MKLTAVIGANYGDEGKGLLTDYLCAGHPDSLVVRFNGGAQAGHTVVTPEGFRHVFSHFGAGTLVSAKTYLSRYFIANPLMWARELPALERFSPVLLIHPDAPVTTPWDMLYNRALECSRGESRHGSCGLGIWETQLRHRGGPETRVRDLFSLDFHLRLAQVKQYFYERNQKDHLDLEDPWDSLALVEDYLKACADFSRFVTLRSTIPLAENIVFEGAQGLLLDEKNRENFPHVSGSRTGLENVLELCADAVIDTRDLEPIYVTRTYLTRHGPGPFPTEDKFMSFEDKTNEFNPWQRELRFGSLDANFAYRIDQDAGDHEVSLAVTHLDQYRFPSVGNLRGYRKLYLSYGPTRATIKERG